MPERLMNPLRELLHQVIAFGGLTNALIPLYAVGVFLSFTLSQAGMVRHHQKERERGYKRNMVINAVGSVATLIVLLIVGLMRVLYLESALPGPFFSLLFNRSM